MRTTRRDALKIGLASLTASLSGWFGQLAANEAKNPQRKRSCILLWMSGGPATIDLWDLKPGHIHGGPYKEINTSVSGIKIGEHLPKIANQMKDLSIVRSLTSKEGDHGRATYLMRTGTLPQGAIEFPTLGALVAKELQSGPVDLPPFVSIAPQRSFSQNAFSSGFLGPQLSPLIVADGQVAQLGNDTGNIDAMLKVQNLDRPQNVSASHRDERLSLMKDLEESFLKERSGGTVDSHRVAYESALRMMKPQTAKVFDLSNEKADLRDRYGRNLFGQGCLLARRLVEHGVPFVEVTLDGWDTHLQNFDRVRNLCNMLDPAWSTLMRDLKDHGLLETTMVVWMGEFGRTPKINPQKGREHFPDVFSTVLGGGGIHGGQVIGQTTKDGMKVEDRAVSVSDFLATVCVGLGIDISKQNMSNVNRPISIVDKLAKPIKEILKT
jgi:hypothetical protein